MYLIELSISGWRRDEVDGRLEDHWEVEQNVHKAQASVDFMLSGYVMIAVLNTGCQI